MNEEDICEDVDCQRCGGDGFIVVCLDDMCRNTGECIHGGGEAPCPNCSDDCGASRPMQRQQGERDWFEFAKAFTARKGIEANAQDTSHQELFYFFTAGAHAEFTGRLDIEHDLAL